MRPLHVTLLIAGLSLAGCAAAPPPPAATAERSDPAGWTRVQASGDFSVAIPPGFERRYVMGIDSAVDAFRSPAAEFGFDYGMYGGGVADTRGFTDASQGAITADGRTGAWSLHRDPSAPADRAWSFRGRFDALDQPPGFRRNPSEPPPPGSPGLTIHGSCATREACLVGREIAASVRFGPPLPAAERLVFLQHSVPPPRALETIEGMLTMDSDGCLMVTDNEGTAGPRLIWPGATRVDASDPRQPRLLGGGQGDTLQLGWRDWVHARGVHIDASAIPARSLNRPAEPCGGPSFLVAEWENAQSRQRRLSPSR